MNAVKCFSFLLLAGALLAVETRENPGKPAGPDAGRVLELEVVQVIEGEGESYFLAMPWDLQLDDHGNIFVKDLRRNQQVVLLKFSPEGRFLDSLVRQGEGPGEIYSFFYYTLVGREIFLFDPVKRKYVFLDKNGGYLREFQLNDQNFFSFLGVHENRLIYMRRIYPYERPSSKLYDVEGKIIGLEQDKKSRQELYSFSSKDFLISMAQGGGSRKWDPVNVVMARDGRMFLNRTQEYLLEALDLNGGGLLFRFRRSYQRVPYEEKQADAEFSRKYNAPVRKYQDDIRTVMINRDRLWVWTSTAAEDQGDLIDLFDFNGQYLDCFYINLPGRLIGLDGEYLYAAVTDENDHDKIVKYRMLNL